MREKESPPALFSSRRFTPLFWTQALGAFNDNVVKNAIVILITFQSASLLGLSPEKLVALCGAIFILPYFLLSGIAGELADQRSKSKLAALTKIWEIGVVGAAGFGFIANSLPFLLLSLFLLGVQATFFGPIKYGVLPELLSSEELIVGNAWVELGTFVAILLGTLLGGILMGIPGNGNHWVAAVSLFISLLGWGASRFIPHRPAQAPNLRVNWNPLTSTTSLIRIARKRKSVWLSVLAISWFWLLGSIVLSILPPLAKTVLGAPESVLTFFLALFSVGVGLGSLLCEKLSFRRLELGIVPLGSIGMSLFALDLGWMRLPEGHSISALLHSGAGLRLCFDLLFFSVAAGLFTVPLYTLMQSHSAPAERSRVIAANNVLNALFMVVGAAALVGLYSFGLEIQSVFLVLAVANALVAILVYFQIPEFMYRFLLWVLSRVLYRLRVQGAEHFPETGAALLVCNHVSFVDWMIISAACPRPIRFVMQSDFMRLPVFGTFARHSKVIPIAGRKEDPALLESAFEKISAELRDGQLVCIFPEGEITRDGKMSFFRKGVERALAKDPVPVVPMALTGMWGSFFSRRYGKAMTRPFRRFHSRIGLRVDAVIPPAQATAAALETAVKNLLSTDG